MLYKQHKKISFSLEVTATGKQPLHVFQLSTAATELFYSVKIAVWDSEMEHPD